MIRTRAFARAHPLITSLVATLAIALTLGIGSALAFQDEAHPPHVERAVPAPNALSYDAVAISETARAHAGAEQYARYLDAAFANNMLRMIAAYEANLAAATRSTASGGGGQAGRCGADMACRRQCESTNNYGAVSAGGTYRGAYQFDQSTWESVGGSGDPAAAPPAEQDARAQILYDQRGGAPWPNC